MMDDFARADLDDWELERAGERADRQFDTNDLLGLDHVRPDLDTYLAEQARSGVHATRDPVRP